MSHGNLDTCYPESVFGGFDPRAKIMGVLGFVVCISLLRDPLHLCFSLGFMLSMLALSGAPVSVMGKRYLLAIPFVLFASISLYFTTGMTQSLAMFLRISSGVLAVVFLTLTTPFFDLLHGLQGLRVPGLLIMLLLFTHRYIFVFLDELERMKQARRARAYHGGGSLFSKNIMKTLSNTAGMLLVRAYGRGLRVQEALRIRGFDGTIRMPNEPRLSVLDCGFTGIFLGMAMLLVLSEYGVIFR